MIRSISLSDFYCFGDSEQLGDLTTVNYVFGPNGSGKTSISESLRGGETSSSHVSWASGPRTIKVYNRDYVRSTFTEAEERGVFLLGEDSKDTFDRIKGLQEDLSRTTKKIDGLQNEIKDTERALETKREALADKVWERRNVIPEVIRREMKGLNKSRGQCLDLTLAKADQFSGRGEETFDSLIPQAEIAFSKDVNERPLIPSVPDLEWIEETLHKVLAAPIVGSADVPLAELINRLEISDWVREGVDHFHDPLNSSALCPFCQQPAPQGLGDQLARIFDDSYQKRRSEVEDYKSKVGAAYRGLVAYRNENIKALQDCIEVEDVTRAFESLEVSLKALATSVEQKLMRPSDVIQPGSVIDHHIELVSLVERANQGIEKGNAIVRTRKEKRPVIIDQAWQEFVRGHLDDLVTVFKGEKETLGKKIEGLRSSAKKQGEFRRSYETELRKLRSKTTSSEATIQRINELLAMSQFYSFKLGNAEQTKDGYRIVRDDGQTADVATLSEGERTFITFLYYYYSLSEVKQDGETERICSVIDDPISSLDGDIMFVVSALTRELISRVRHGEHDRVSQVLLLTHNTRFHEEVSYDHRGEESPKVKFYRIRKFSPEPNQIEDCGEKNPIRSTYQELWDEVADAQLRRDRRMPWLPNVLRRILESYFSTLGGQRNLYEIGEGLKPTEKALHDALIAWSHRGSHTIVDAEVYAQSSTSNGPWLDAFERVFRESADGAHMGHYEMMMGEARKYVS